ILLRGLLPEEIKDRFITEALGPSVLEWFRKVDQEFKEFERKHNQVLDSVPERLGEIEAINGTYKIERKARAEALLKEVQDESQKIAGSMHSIMTQVPEIVRGSSIRNEREILLTILGEWNARADRMTERHKNFNDEYGPRIKAIADEK
ncbi:MAG: hypothetical protein ACRD4D_03840, partial [Candidatus Acidiferrales bacterium]